MASGRVGNLSQCQAEMGKTLSAPRAGMGLFDGQQSRGDVAKPPLKHGVNAMIFDWYWYEK